MNWNEMKKFVISKGYVFERHGKKHDVYRHSETNEYILIERHWSQEVRKGIMKDIMKRIGN